MSQPVKAMIVFRGETEPHPVEQAFRRLPQVGHTIFYGVDWWVIEKVGWVVCDGVAEPKLYVRRIFGQRP